jgi:hypothetical protein
MVRSRIHMEWSGLRAFLARARAARAGPAALRLFRRAASGFS